MLIEDRALNQVTALYFKRMEGSDGAYQPPRQAAGKVGSEFQRNLVPLLGSASFIEGEQ